MKKHKVEIKSSGGEYMMVDDVKSFSSSDAAIKFVKSFNRNGTETGNNSWRWAEFNGKDYLPKNK